jgi:hypothetical protein
MRVRLFDGLDLLQVLRDSQMQRRLPCFLAGFFKTGCAQFPPFKLMVLPTLAFESLRNSWSSPSAAPLSSEIPFEVIAAIGKCFPVGRALLVARDREKFPTVADGIRFVREAGILPLNYSRLLLFSMTSGTAFPSEHQTNTVIVSAIAAQAGSR